jgi:hypothetical protein
MEKILLLCLLVAFIVVASEWLEARRFVRSRMLRRDAGTVQAGFALRG